MEETLAEQIAILNNEIQQEETQWKALRLNTRMFSPDAIFVSCQVDAICSLLIAKEICTQEEADLALKRVILETMQTLRSNYIREKITRRGGNGIIRP